MPGVERSAAPPRRRASPTAGPRRREMLLAAARAEFVGSGYDGARTRTIARRADTTESVLYRHFASKEELFDAAVLEPLTRWVETVAVPAVEQVRDAPAEHRMRSLLEVNRALRETMLEITPLLGAALFSGSERGRAFWRDRFQPLLARSFEQTAQAMGDWADPAYSGRFLLLTGFGTFLADALDRHFGTGGGDGDVDGDDTAVLYVRLLLHGAASPSVDPPDA